MVPGGTVLDDPGPNVDGVVVPGSSVEGVTVPSIDGANVVPGWIVVSGKGCSVDGVTVPGPGPVAVAVGVAVVAGLLELKITASVLEQI